jgi:hypothetical protein
MATRILLAGVLGGLALFMWGGLAHEALGLGEVGLKYLPQQQPVMDALKASVSQSGFYFFPEMDAAHKLPADKMGGAYGFLIYHPGGAGGPMTGQLVNECVLNIVLALLAAFLLSRTRLNGYLSRVGFVTLLGLTVGLMTNVEYWNWYGFPSSYTAVSVFIVLVGFLLVGLIAGALIKESNPRRVASEEKVMA